VWEPEPGHYGFLQLMDFLYDAIGAERQIMYRHLVHCDHCRYQLSAIIRSSNQRRLERERLLAATDFIFKEITLLAGMFHQRTPVSVFLTAVLMEYLFDA